MTVVHARKSKKEKKDDTRVLRDSASTLAFDSTHTRDMFHAGVLCLLLTPVLVSLSQEALIE